MHCVCLGVAPMVVANVLVDVVESGHFGVGSRSAKLQRLFFDEYVPFCKKHGIADKVEQFTEEFRVS